jgi:hypothetical protein
MSRDEPYQHPRSHLFTLHVWQEAVGNDQTEWRGKLHLITDGNVRYFCGWEALVPLLIAMLSELETPSDLNV